MVFGGATIPQDNVYAGLNNLDGTSATTLNGNNTYKLTFMPPVTNPKTLPVVGTLPPTANDSQGNPRGLWSITVYQPDATAVRRPVPPPDERSEHRLLDREHSRDRRRPVDGHNHRHTLRVGPAEREQPDPVRLHGRNLRPHARRPVLRREPPDAQDRPEDQGHDVLVQGLDHVAADAIGRATCRSSTAARRVPSSR